MLCVYIIHDMRCITMYISRFYYVLLSVYIWHVKLIIYFISVCTCVYPTLQPNSRKGYRVSFPPTRDPQRNSQHRKISTNMALDNSRLSIVSNSTSSSAKFRVSLLIFIDFPFIYRYVMNIS